jgi:hypothetical protein
MESTSQGYGAAEQRQCTCKALLRCCKRVGGAQAGEAGAMCFVYEQGVVLCTPVKYAEGTTSAT